eukprot:CAMPEP_0119122352 /NCGR_PEP_ID=MMETSP1310-20130426/2627_1 /TAXON_ID=464262 /ORGANISM="Genus nov. species nov., Strain RCC2339" /LENGTH=232 /DNA_ID=CAMNT_0007111995 /DNA_START=89 /DNA_END=784 /DNA_ORIENTATION=+
MDIIPKRDTSKPFIEVEDVRTDGVVGGGAVEDAAKHKGIAYFLKEAIHLFQLEGQSSPTTGKLDKDAFMRCLARTELGHDAPKDQLELMYTIFDQDGDGAVSLDEFVVGMAISSEGSPEEKAELIFKSIDRDHDGFLSRDELENRLIRLYSLHHKENTKTVLRTSGPLPPSSNFIGLYNFVSNPRAHEMCVQAMSQGRIPKALDSIFGDADLDHDGKISLKEWVKAASTNED